MPYSFKDFLDQIIVENLHPELHAIATGKSKKYGTSKQAQIAKKIKELTARGENTGIEGNMPKGSSRAYLPIKEHMNITLDNRPTKLKTGLKVAIRATLDKHHYDKDHNGMSLGQLQNEAEGGDHLVNSHYRIITKDDKGNYHSNTESGIFPPQIDHDHDNHEWSHVGHVDKATEGFRNVTRTATHPLGISHREFADSLERAWDKDHGKYWEKTPEKEKHIDYVESHPLVQKFLDHQRNFGFPPHDYRQINNLGMWTHPHTGEKHIVARDHGFSKTVMDAYHEARYGKIEYLRKK
jgi:hypothetical protein